MRLPLGRLAGRAVRPPLRRLALAATLGALAATGQAPLGWWGVTLVALSGLFWLVAAEPRPGAAGWLGWLAGAGYFAAALFWIVEPFLVDLPRHGWMAPFALLLMAFGMALFWLVAAALAALCGPTRRWRLLLLAVTMAGGELLRGYVFTGFPWALLGHVWIDTPVAQAAAWIGPVGLSLLTLALAGLPHLPPAPLGRGLALAAAAAALAAVWGAGAARLAAPGPAPQRDIVLRVVQPNAAQHLKWRDDMNRLFFERQLAATAAPAARRPDLVIWPETAVPWLLDRPGPVLEMITAAAGGVPVALGIQRTEGTRGFNSLAVIDAAARPAAVYDKVHLVPFGEYIPFGDVLTHVGITAFAAREGNGYTPGPAPAILDLGALGRVLPLICYEAVFPQDLRAAPGRADWILQVTNDAWFGSLAGPYQHLAQARLRAVEQGLPLVRSANTGVSAVIDAKGRVLEALPLNTEGFLDAPLPAALPATPYARTGDWPVAAVLATLFLLLALTGHRKAVDRPAARV